MRHHSLTTVKGCNSQNILPPSAWTPLELPHSEADQPLFHAYILAPGFSTAFHSAMLVKSAATICRYRRIAREALRANGSIRDLITEFVCSITPEIALAMAQKRGRTQMPYLSRLAVGEFLKRGVSRKEVARMFKCSVRTVSNIASGKGGGYAPFSGKRSLTQSQSKPPASTKPD